MKFKRGDIVTYAGENFKPVFENRAYEIMYRCRVKINDKWVDGYVYTPSEVIADEIYCQAAVEFETKFVEKK